MALDPTSGRRSVSPESSGRESPLPRIWRSEFGNVPGEPDTPQSNDKSYRKYAVGIDRALAPFDTALHEWADYISFLNRLLKALQSRTASISAIPARTTVAKRLSQCLHPTLPSGVHQKALEVYNFIFGVIGTEQLSRDLSLYLPGLAPILSFASLSVRTPFLGLLERHFVQLDPRALRPAMKSIILSLLPGLEEETSEDFDRTLKLVDKFKVAIRPPDSEQLTEAHACTDDYFWQCFFLASITGNSRRQGALAYLSRNLPHLAPSTESLMRVSGHDRPATENLATKLIVMVSSPEPGLLLRCFAAGLADEQLLIKRGFLDLLVSHLPLHSPLLRTRVKAADVDLLLSAAVSVVTRRDMSLNRRLWAWLLGPEPAQPDQDGLVESPTTTISPSEPPNQASFTKTHYFEDFGLQPLNRALLAMITSSPDSSPAERARPFKICLSLMDRWEIGGIVVPDVFLPVVDSVRKYKQQAKSKDEFAEVIRSASVFFDGVEGGLIYGEIVGLLAKAAKPGTASADSRLDSLALVSFILSNFNVREEEMVLVHAPLASLAALCMLEDAQGRGSSSPLWNSSQPTLLREMVNTFSSLLDLTLDRAFPASTVASSSRNMESKTLASLSSIETLERIRAFYVNDQGSLDATATPFHPVGLGELLIRRACNLVHGETPASAELIDATTRLRILFQVMTKLPTSYAVDKGRLLSFMHNCLDQPFRLSFDCFSAILLCATTLYSTSRISSVDLSGLVIPLVRSAWRFLSASEPKYHVETVKCLWRLQSSVPPNSREVEAAISGLMIASDVVGAYPRRPADPGRIFAVLWAHTLQDGGHSHADRRSARTPVFDSRTAPRLAGMDHYQVMLTRPLFLMLDALADERTQLFMATKTWLHNLTGVEKLFQIFVTAITNLPFLDAAQLQPQYDAPDSGPHIRFTDDDDLDLCLYYLRTLSNVLLWAPDAFLDVLVLQSASPESAVPLDIKPALLYTEAEDGDLSFHEHFLRLCMICLAGSSQDKENEQVRERVSQLHRCALTVLHRLLLNPAASNLIDRRIRAVMIERLQRSLDGTDPYVQVLLLDVLYATLRLPNEGPSRDVAAPTVLSEKRPSVPVDATTRPSPPSSISAEARQGVLTPPLSLLKCLRAGLSSDSSRPVLDSWVAFLTECLPLYSESIFQIVIPLVETFCQQVSLAFDHLREIFRTAASLPGPSAAYSIESVSAAPESTLISLINGLERVLAAAHDRLIAEESRSQAEKRPDQPQSFFGNMVAGVFTTDQVLQARSATANDRLTVHLAFQDAVRICFRVWTWGQGYDGSKNDPSSAASFSYTSLRTRNRARRLLEHLFAAETLECLETVIGVWRGSWAASPSDGTGAEVISLLSALDASRPKHTVPAIFHAIYSRTNPAALLPASRSTLTMSIPEVDLVVFLVEYARSLEDDAMDEIWQDCMTFLRDLLSNPFPHRQTLPGLLEFAAVLGEKVDNTNFGEQRKMRRDLGDLFIRLLAALFTTRPMSFADTAAVASASQGQSDPKPKGPPPNRWGSGGELADRGEDVVAILALVVPSLPKILLEPDRIVAAAGVISSNVIVPTLRSKSFPDTVSKNTLLLLQGLSRLPNNQKAWKKDVGDAFNDPRFFGCSIGLVKDDWLPLLHQWTMSDKDRMSELLGRISPPSTAGIVFGVGATSARLEADRKTQLNLRRIATVVMASGPDAFVAEVEPILDKLVELLGARATSSPSSATRAEVFMVMRALVLQIDSVHLATLWPVANSEIYTAVASVLAADHSPAAETYNNASVLQACKLLDLLVCLAPDDFQLHEWLFVTDTVDAVYRTSSHQPIALLDELAEELGLPGSGPVQGVADASGSAPARPSGSGTVVPSLRRPLLGQGSGGINDDVSLDRKDELVAKVLRPFFGQLGIFAFESTYSMRAVDADFCVDALLKDIFDERSIAKAL